MPGVPAIGALPAVPSAAAGIQPWWGSAGGALANLPQDLLAQQLATSAAADQQAQFGQHAIERLANVGIANPAAAQSPQYKQMVEKAAKMTGIPVPYAPDGSIDVHALYPKRAMTEQEQQAALQLDPQARAKAYSGRYDLNIPPGFYDIPQQFGMGEKTAFENNLQRELANIADPKGAGPQGFVEFMRLHEQVAKQALGLSDISEVVNDPQFQSSINARADNETRRLVELGIVKPQQEAAYKQKYLHFLTTKLQDDLATKREGLAIQSKREQDYSTRVSDDMAKWRSNNAIKLKALDQAERNFQTAQSSKNSQVQTAWGRLAAQAASKAQDALDSLQRTAANYAVGGQPVPQELQTEIETLQGRVKNLNANAGLFTDPSMQQATNEATTRAVTGADRVQQVGQTYTDAQGNVWKQLPNGKWQRIQ